MLSAAPCFVRFLGSLTYALYVAANIKEERLLLFAAAALMGFGAALLWVAQGAHIAKCSRENELKYHCVALQVHAHFGGTAQPQLTELTKAGSTKMCVGCLNLQIQSAHRVHHRVHVPCPLCAGTCGQYMPSDCMLVAPTGTLWACSGAGWCSTNLWATRLPPGSFMPRSRRPPFTLFSRSSMWAECFSFCLSALFRLGTRCRASTAWTSPRWESRAGTVSCQCPMPMRSLSL